MPDEWVRYSGKRANEKKTTNLASSQGRKKGVKKKESLPKARIK